MLLIGEASGDASVPWCWDGGMLLEERVRALLCCEGAQKRSVGDLAASQKAEPF